MAEPATAEPLPLPGGAGTERALEEAAASGNLILAGRRLRDFPAAAARRWDLSDTTQADLSQNLLAAVPPAALSLPALERLVLSHNLLRRVPPAIGNLQALTHLDLSRNQLRSLPPALCSLPLRVLDASANRLTRLPENIGALAALRQLDVASNELRSLPGGVGRLKSLRDLNLRRNLLTALPAELSELPLVRLDFSCNRVAAIPRSFRRLRHLQTLLTDNNPLQSPPAQICLKGRVHIFKYLQVTPPTRFPEEFGDGLDSGFNSVDSGTFGDFSEQRRAGGGDSDPEEQQRPLEGIESQDLGHPELRCRLRPPLIPERPIEFEQHPKVKPRPPPGLLAGFALFYGLVMAALISAYRALCGS